jgi:excisionase family DNA binding protein
MIPENILTLTVEGVRDATGLGRNKIYELIKSGRLESVVIGSRRLIKKASLERLIEEGETTQRGANAKEAIAARYAPAPRAARAEAGRKAAAQKRRATADA